LGNSREVFRHGAYQNARRRDVPCGGLCKEQADFLSPLARHSALQRAPAHDPRCHPPHVEYSLTEFGRSLEPILLLMSDWGANYQGELRVQRGRALETETVNES
jgi:hypothetical protein